MRPWQLRPCAEHQQGLRCSLGSEGTRRSCGQIQTTREKCGRVFQAYRSVFSTGRVINVLGIDLSLLEADHWYDAISGEKQKSILQPHSKPSALQPPPPSTPSVPSSLAREAVLGHNYKATKFHSDTGSSRGNIGILWVRAGESRRIVTALI